MFMYRKCARICDVQEEVVGLRELVPVLIDVVRAALAAGEEDVTSIALGNKHVCIFFPSTFSTR